MTLKELDIRRMSVSSGRKELSVSSKILHRLGSCGRTSRANGVNQIAIIDILVGLTIIGLSKSIYELLFEIKRDEAELEMDSAVTPASLLQGEANVTQEQHAAESLREIALYLFFGSIMFFQSVQLLLGFILFRGSVKRHMAHCKIWFIGQIILMMLEVGLFAFFATVIPHKIATWICSIMFLGSVLYKIYCLYVVKSFMVELKQKKMRKASHSSGPPLIPATSKYDEQLSPIYEN